MAWPTNSVNDSLCDRLEQNVKPKVFIGSSKESLNIAYSVQKNLEYACEPTVWNQGVFSLSKTSIEALVEASKKYDFAIFCMTPDDIALIRNESNRVARDNVIFEFGLFLGAIGREKVFFIVPRDAQEMHLPTDLLGLTPGTYDALRADNNFEAALGPACHQIVGQISSLSVRKYSEEMWQRFRSARKDVYSLVAIELTKTNGSTECMGVPFESMEFWDLRKSADLLSCRESDRLLMDFLSVAASIDDNRSVATPIEAAIMERNLSGLEKTIDAWKKRVGHP
jgi:predicted nucleotide-binding protein